MATTTQLIVRPEIDSVVRVQYQTTDGDTTIYGTVTATDDDSILIRKITEYDNDDEMAIDDGELWSLFDLEQADPAVTVVVLPASIAPNWKASI